jgi:hypothetical protein
MGPPESSCQSSRVANVCGQASEVWSRARSVLLTQGIKHAHCIALVRSAHEVHQMPGTTRLPHTATRGALRGRQSRPQPLLPQCVPLQALHALEALVLAHKKGAEARTSGEQRCSGVGLRKTARPQRACGGSRARLQRRQQARWPPSAAKAGATRAGPRGQHGAFSAQEHEIAVCIASEHASPPWGRTRGAEFGVAGMACAS